MHVHTKDDRGALHQHQHQHQHQLTAYPVRYLLFPSNANSPLRDSTVHVVIPPHCKILTCGSYVL